MKIERPELMAYILIIVGLLLLVFTFIMAFLMLTSVISIPTSMGLPEALGEILGPIAEGIIKVMFLGVMGWTGSIVTMRGIQLYKESKSAMQPPKPEEKPPEKA
ncbi:MAG: hypothetical protein QW493_05160 [Candidatus Bathyarchaeia archaeon]